MIDHYLWGSCDRISPEAPVQVLNVKKESSVLGGAGNVINNLVILGSVVDVISFIILPLLQIIFLFQVYKLLFHLLN